jgi:integrase
MTEGLRMRPRARLYGPLLGRAGRSFPTATGSRLTFESRLHRGSVIRFHDLRHTCASLLLAQNVPARIVMEILGHSRLAMTTDL